MFLVRLEVEEVPPVMRAVVRAEAFLVVMVVEDTAVVEDTVGQGVAKGPRELTDRGRNKRWIEILQDQRTFFHAVIV
jgi:hypothetical protein